MGPARPFRVSGTLKQCGAALGLSPCSVKWGNQIVLQQITRTNEILAGCGEGVGRVLEMKWHLLGPKTSNMLSKAAVQKDGRGNSDRQEREIGGATLVVGTRPRALRSPGHPDTSTRNGA